MERRIAKVIAALMLLMICRVMEAGPAAAQSWAVPGKEAASQGGESPWEVHGRLSHIDADGLGIVEHRYTWHLRPGGCIRAELEAAFDPVIEILADGKELVARSDDGSDPHVARLSTKTDGGIYVIKVTSAAGDETGPYTLRLWLAGGRVDGPAREAEAASGVVDRGPLTEGAFYSGFVDSDRPIARHVIEEPKAGATYDVWLFSEYDLDLYAAVIVDGAVARDAASKEAFGYEYIRIVASEGADSIVIHAALYEPAAAQAPYQLLVRAYESGAPGQPDPGNIAASAGKRLDHYGGRLVPGERISAGIVPWEYTTQIWTVAVPPNTSRVEIGIFDADRDMDLALEPGWEPSPHGIEHGIQSATRRWNDRITIEGEGRELPPGLYTVAVWPSGAEQLAGDGGVIGYAIQLELDGRLPPSSSYPLLTDDELNALPGAERTRHAAVWIESAFYSGAGAVIAPEGLILTNYSAVFDCHPEVSAPIGCIEEQAGEGPVAHGDDYLIWMVDRATGAAFQFFVAEMVAALPRYDLALLKIVRDVDGNPWAPPGAAGVLPYLDVDLGAPLARAGAAGRMPGPPLVIAVDFPKGGQGGPAISPPIPPLDVTVHDVPIPLYELKGAGAVQHSGTLLVAPRQGLLLGLISKRHRLPTDDGDTWIAVPTTLVPAGWLTPGSGPQ